MAIVYREDVGERESLVHISIFPRIRNRRDRDAEVGDWAPEIYSEKASLVKSSQTDIISLSTRCIKLSVSCAVFSNVTALSKE
jgi:hypothetical protein